jgi:hypothetical protein
MADVLPEIRAARSEELPRARYLFASTFDRPPANASYLLALRARPIERIVATAAWWHEGQTIKFLLAHQPGYAMTDAVSVQVPELLALPELDALPIGYGRMLDPDEQPAPWFEQHGFSPGMSERVMEVPGVPVYERVGAMYARFHCKIPSTWRTEPICLHSPEIVWPLVEPYRLTKFETLALNWLATDSTGYDKEHSNLLFDGDELLGALLVRTDPHCLAVDIRVVRSIATRMRSLANLALFAHIQRVVGPTEWRVLAFRGDDAEHRETANLGLRMGGREVGRRHAYTYAARLPEVQRTDR